MSAIETEPRLETRSFKDLVAEHTAKNDREWIHLKHKSEGISKVSNALFGLTVVLLVLGLVGLVLGSLTGTVSLVLSGATFGFGFWLNVMAQLMHIRALLLESKNR